MEQLRRGVEPDAIRAPMMPDAEKAAVLLDDVAARGRALAELRRAGEEGGTAGLQARIAVRQAVRDAWAEGIEHTVQLSTLAEAGLLDTASLAGAGWEPVLLDAIDRGQGWGRPSKAAASVWPVGATGLLRSAADAEAVLDPPLWRLLWRPAPRIRGVGRADHGDSLVDAGQGQLQPAAYDQQLVQCRGQGAFPLRLSDPGDQVVADVGCDRASVTTTPGAGPLQHLGGHLLRVHKSLPAVRQCPAACPQPDGQRPSDRGCFKGPGRPRRVLRFPQLNTFNRVGACMDTGGGPGIGRVLRRTGCMVALYCGVHMAVWLVAYPAAEPVLGVTGPSWSR